MKTQIKTLIEQAESKWESWNDLGGQARADILLRWSEQMKKEVSDEDSSASMVQYQINNALPFIADEMLMPGPTGESNHLFTAGRGIFVVSCDESAPLVSMVGMICSALLAGNCIILSFSDAQAPTADMLLSTLLSAGVPKCVAQVAPLGATSLLISDVATAGVAYVGDKAEALKINQQLASRKGLLAQLVLETDLVDFSHITDSYFILRFITEKTRSINITAIGGNAALLALGGGDL